MCSPDKNHSLTSCGRAIFKRACTISILSRFMTTGLRISIIDFWATFVDLQSPQDFRQASWDVDTRHKVPASKHASPIRMTCISSTFPTRIWTWMCDSTNVRIIGVQSVEREASGKAHNPSDRSLIELLYRYSCVQRYTLLQTHQHPHKSSTNTFRMMERGKKTEIETLLTLLN